MANHNSHTFINIMDLYLYNIKFQKFYKLLYFLSSLKTVRCHRGAFKFLNFLLMVLHNKSELMLDLHPLRAQPKGPLVGSKYDKEV